MRFHLLVLALCVSACVLAPSPVAAQSLTLQQLWSRSYPATAPMPGAMDAAVAMTFDQQRIGGGLGSASSVFVTGYKQLESTLVVCTTLQYDLDGNVLAAVQFPKRIIQVPGQPANIYCRPKAIAAVNEGQTNHYIFVLAEIQEYGHDRDLILLAYDQGLDLLWTQRYAGPNGGDDTAVSIDGTIYFAGGSLHYYVAWTGTSLDEAGRRRAVVGVLDFHDVGQYAYGPKFIPPPAVAPDHISSEPVRLTFDGLNGTRFWVGYTAIDDSASDHNCFAAWSKDIFTGTETGPVLIGWEEFDKSSTMAAMDRMATGPADHLFMTGTRVDANSATPHARIRSVIFNTTTLDWEKMDFDSPDEDFGMLIRAAAHLGAPTGPEGGLFVSGQRIDAASGRARMVTLYYDISDLNQVVHPLAWSANFPTDFSGSPDETEPGCMDAELSGLWPPEQYGTMAAVIGFWQRQPSGDRQWRVLRYANTTGAEGEPNYALTVTSNPAPAEDSPCAILINLIPQSHGYPVYDFYTCGRWMHGAAGYDYLTTKHHEEYTPP